MDDLINRQAAIEACLRYNGVGWVWSQILDEIEKLPSVERHGKWIPCKERLPDDGVNVLVQFIDGYTEICRLLGGCWEVLYGEYTGIHTAVAWMPLPEPYKGDD